MKLRVVPCHPDYGVVECELTVLGCRSHWVVQIYPKFRHWNRWVTVKYFNKKENAELHISQLVRKHPDLYEVVDAQTES